MSKKMWHKIFKSKTKNAKNLTAAQKINKRSSIYEEYQQLNDLLNNEMQVQPIKFDETLSASKANGHQAESSAATVAAAAVATTTVAITTNKQQKQKQQQQQQTAPLSTFSRVVNTFRSAKSSESLVRLECNNNNNKLANSEPPTPLIATTTTTTGTTTAIMTAITAPNSRRLSQVVFVVNTLELAGTTSHFEAFAANTSTNNSTNNNNNNNNNNEKQNSSSNNKKSFNCIAPLPAAVQSCITVTNIAAAAAAEIHSLHATRTNNNFINSNLHANQIANAKNENSTIEHLEVPVLPEGVQLQLAPCPVCNRTFNPVALQKHVGICEKMSSRKRNVFDSSRQRREGTDLATYVLPKNFGLPNAAAVAGVEVYEHATAATTTAATTTAAQQQQVCSPIMQRKKSDELVRSTVRTSVRRSMQNNNNKNRVESQQMHCETAAVSARSQIPTPANANASANGNENANSNATPFARNRIRSSERSFAKCTQQIHNERCPHCNRKFGIKAYDRHVEWCKEKAIQASIKNSSSIQNKAKERLDARQQYKPPNLKTKRSINRDKYSGMVNEEQQQQQQLEIANNNNTNMVDNKNIALSMSTMTSSTTSDKSPTKIPKPERSISTPKPLVAQRTLNFNMESNNNNELCNKLLKLPKKSIKQKSKKITNTHDQHKQEHTMAKQPNVNSKNMKNKTEINENFDAAVTIPMTNNTTTTTTTNTHDQHKQEHTMAKQPNVNSKNMKNKTEINENFDAAVTIPMTNNTTTTTTTTTRRRNIMPKTKKEKLDLIEKKFELPPVAHMQFEQLNDFVNSTGSIVAACHISIKQTSTRSISKHSLADTKLSDMHKPDVDMLTECCVPKSRSATSLVRTARRQMRTKEHPNIDIKTIQQQTEDGECNNGNDNSNDSEKDIKSMETSKSDDSLMIMPISSNISLPLSNCCKDFLRNDIDININGNDDDGDNDNIASQLSCKLEKKLKPNTDNRIIYRKRKLKSLNSKTSISSSTEPLRAMPLEKESLEALTKSIGTLSQLDLTKIAADEENPFQYDDIIGSDGIMVGEDENGIAIIKAPPKSFSNLSLGCLQSGLNDKYDPFLSAKRQLEELCSPTSPTEPLLKLNTALTSTPISSTPSTPGLNLMSTSLTLSSFTSQPQTQTQTQTQTQNQSQNQLNGTHSTQSNNKTGNQTATTQLTNLNRTSSFRRTSSLRGPRRSPLLPSRPLFTHNYRPTIQRGLSDEGPISTNFLKPEEYDEMPVRAVCVNDFAITNSPRVVRRDSSISSNRKQQLKLQLENTNASENATKNNATPMPEEPAKYVAKTDSLAVFLKYEDELEKLQATNATESTHVVNPLNSKELKDKSNILNKQNSAKNLKVESNIKSLPSLEQQHKMTTSLTSTVNSQLSARAKPSTAIELVTKENNDNLCNNVNNSNNKINNNSQIRLEPLVAKPNTPLTKPSTPVSSKPNTPGYMRRMQLPALPALNTPPVTLNTIFSETKGTCNNTSDYNNKERKKSTGNDYIDPKLINKCDNLSVNLKLVLKSSDTSEQLSDTSSAASTVKEAINADAVSHFSKLLPLSRNQSLESPSQLSYSSSAQSSVTQINGEKRNSIEGRNLLKRKMRLGRNQFLYDASPEAEISSADDETNPSSMEYDGQRCKNAEFSACSMQQQSNKPFKSNDNKMKTTTKAGILPGSIPVLDDFDFEEFLSSFENDDEQFPLFKDCREFLMNRTSNKQRSLLTSSSSKTNNNQTTTPTATTTIQTPTIEDNNNIYNTPFLTKATTTTTRFQYPTTNLLTSNSNSNTNFKSKSTSIPRSNSSGLNATSFLTADDDLHNNVEPFKHHGKTLNNSDADQKKREIFISIETEQNDLGRSPISPESLRQMVGNTQTHVEVEVDGNENKFSKITDDDIANDGGIGIDIGIGNGSSSSTGVAAAIDDDGDDVISMLSTSAPPPPPPTMFQNEVAESPSVQFNNAKNLMQKIQDDFHKFGDVSINTRQAMLSNTCYEQEKNIQRPATTSSVYGQQQTPQQQQQQQQQQKQQPQNSSQLRELKMRNVNTQLGDSDEFSSLDSYPISSSQSSRHGVSSKLSSDSAYGSLSRQRSIELMGTPRQRMQRPLTASAATSTKLPDMINVATQAQYVFTKSRSRNFSNGSSSSGSDNSLPPLPGLRSNNYQLGQQQQQQQQQPNYCNNNDFQPTTLYMQNNRNKNDIMVPIDNPITETVSTHSLTSNNSINSNNSNSMMTTSMKMSKFCHECGAKFIIEHAKFCMDCGVKRIIL